MSVATPLGFGAVAVFLASVIAVIVRQPDSQRPSSAVRPHVVIPSSAAPTTSTTTMTPAAQRSAVRPHQTPTHVLGQTVHRSARGQAPQALPYTGPAPVVPTGAIGLLALIGGAWLLVRWPVSAAATGYDAASVTGVSVTVRNPRSEGAIERLRSPGHQFDRPSSAATDGTSSDLTTNVSSNSPAVTANPVS